MFREEWKAAGDAAVAKSTLLRRNATGYLALSVLAGMFIGFGVLLTNTIGGVLAGSASTKVITGVSFTVALSLVVTAGAELFTGNNFVMTAGMLQKKVSLKEAVRLWAVCYIGNLLGALLLSALFHFAGLDTEATLSFMVAGAAAKTAPSALALFCRGILCNMLVCLAVWCTFRLKSEPAKLIMVFWCLFAFVTTGFEHSIANMTLFGVLLMQPAGSGMLLTGALYNLVLVTLGNMAGGIALVAVPYFLAQKE